MPNDTHSNQAEEVDRRCVYADTEVDRKRGGTEGILDDLRRIESCVANIDGRNRAVNAGVVVGGFVRRDDLPRSFLSMRRCNLERPTTISQEIELPCN